MGQKIPKKIIKTDDEWRKVLGKEEFEVCRKSATERPFSGQYTDCDEQGIYCCVCCGEPLFSSESKFDSGCGWPSFSLPVDLEQISERNDYSHGMIRKEVICSTCDAHLGHVFKDGPMPTRLRYCINSVALKLNKN